MAVGNEAPDITCDVYVAFIMPDGTLLCICAAGLVTDITPYATGIPLPEDFAFGPGLVFQIPIPVGVPAGSYQFAAALSTPGGLNIVGDISMVSFAISEQ
ncbi:hypothetical protein J7M28_00650 [bacterium]|nr:hypothetical protein [bacterium]